jgi:hypothetical protein
MHIGERIRTRSVEIGVSATELGRILKMTKQNVYGIYKRKSIDTHLLQKIGEALEYDFFAFYYSPQFYKNKTLELKKSEEKYKLLKDLYEAKTGKKVPRLLI